MRKPRTIPSFAGTGDGLIHDLNTTPLIDVMLVLLVMFIMIIPVTSHKVPLDLPQGSSPPAERVVHRLELDAAGGLALDGRVASEAELPALLAPIAADPASDLHLRVDGETPYDRFDHVLAIVKRAGITRLGMVDNARFVEGAG
jgi:biopolymer transport protein ExbD